MTTIRLFRRLHLYASYTNKKFHMSEIHRDLGQAPYLKPDEGLKVIKKMNIPKARYIWCPIIRLIGTGQQNTPQFSNINLDSWRNKGLVSDTVKNQDHNYYMNKMKKVNMPPEISDLQCRRSRTISTVCNISLAFLSGVHPEDSISLYIWGT